MKRFVSIVLAVLSVCSCGKNLQGEDNIVPVEWQGYVYFGADVMTKAPIYKDLNGQDYGVIAFKYDSDWNTFKAVGKPSSAAGDNDRPGFNFPTKVSCSETGLCTYRSKQINAPVEWEQGKVYSFFAYFPYSEATSGNGVILNSTDGTAGVPSIKYTVPSWTDPSSLSDVMTAAAIDEVNSGDGTVGFTFKHRLCCLNVEARNFNDSPETVKNLKINITSEMFESVVVPLDPSIEIAQSGNHAGASYQIIPDSDDSKVTVPVYDGISSSTTNLSGDNNIILIPQNVDDIMGDTNGDGVDEVILPGKRKLTGNISFTDKSGNPQSQEFESDKNFEAGKKYTFVITFANGSISIAIIESGEWTDMNQDIIFE